MTFLLVALLPRPLMKQIDLSCQGEKTGLQTHIVISLLPQN